MMISHSPLAPVQVAVVARLKQDTALVALLAGKAAVFDQPPEGEAEPYIRVGDMLSSADNDLTSFGRTITFTIHIWTRARSNGPGFDIAARVAELLDEQERPLSALTVGHRVVSCRQEFDQALTDPDPQLRHHVLRFRIVTSQEV